MESYMKLLDTSSELIIQRYRQGVKLIKPEKLKYFSGQDQCQRVSDLLNLPINIAFLNTGSIIQNINETLIKCCGFSSVKDTLGKTVRIAATKEAADFSINHDQKVVKTNSLIIKEENYIRKIDAITFQAITAKMPWYDSNDKIIGLLSLASTIGAPCSIPLAESLMVLAKTGLLDQRKNMRDLDILPGETIAGVYLSKREAQCMYYLLKGMSFKKIGIHLGLSNRTIGHYIDNIRGKFNVNSKEALIEKVLKLSS